MKSIAAYYALLALNSEQQAAERRRAEVEAARSPRRSRFARARAFVTSGRSTRPAASAA